MPRPASSLLTLLLAFLPAALAVPARAAADAEARPAVDPEILHHQSEIAAGFNSADADRVARLLSPRLKTYVACRLLAEADGYYGSDQLKLLLRRLFRGRETTGFSVVTPAAPRPDGQAVLQAIWAYRDAASPTGQLHLAFTLAREAGAWRLREIRDLS